MSDKLHELISFTKAYYAENGVAPSKPSLWAAGFSDYQIRKYGMLSILEMAGISDVRVNSTHVQRITNEIFEKDIYQQINNYKEREFSSPEIKTTILIAGDTHFPFTSKRTLDKFLNFNRRMQPENVVQVGDLYDMYAHSKFPKSQNSYTAMDEERIGREMAESFFNDIKRDNKGAIIHNTYGNHDIRPVKRVLEVAPSVEHIVQKHLERLMTFDGVNLVSDHRDLLEIDGILFHHGYLGKLGDHRDAALQNIVLGHTHRGGVSYRKIRNETLWELNAGFMGDPESKALSYTPSKIQNYTLGFGFIDIDGPRFIHL